MPCQQFPNSWVLPKNPSPTHPSLVWPFTTDPSVLLFVSALPMHARACMRVSTCMHTCPLSRSCCQVCLTPGLRLLQLTLAGCVTLSLQVYNIRFALRVWFTATEFLPRLLPPPWYTRVLTFLVSFLARVSTPTAVATAVIQQLYFFH